MARRIAILATLATAIALASSPHDGAAQVVVSPDPIAIVSVPPAGIASGTITLELQGGGSAILTGLERDACDPEATAAATPADLPFELGSQGSQTVAVTCDYGSGSDGSAVGFAIRRCEVEAVGATATLADFTILCVPSGGFTLGTSATQLDFGSVGIDAAVTMPLTITNASATTATRLSLQIGDQGGNFQLGAPCTQDVIGCDADVTVPPMGTTTIDLSCTPTSAAALAAPLLVVSDNGGVAAQVELMCDGFASALGQQIALERSVLDVGDVAAATGSASGSVLVANTGGQPLTISSISLVGSNALDWTVTAPAPCSVGTCTLAAGSSTQLLATFRPTNLGDRDTTLQIDSDDPLHPTANVALAGTGVGGELALATAIGSADLGSVGVGATASFQLALRNDGNRRLDNVMLAVAPAGPYTLVPATLSIPAAGEATVAIECTPTTEGSAAATLTITAAAAVAGSPIALALACEGVAAAIAASPAPIQLGEIRTGEAPHQVTVSVSTLGSASVTAMDPVLDAGSDTQGSAELVVSDLSSHTVTGAQPATFTVTATPLDDGPIVDRIAITAGSGTIVVPVTGDVVTAAIAAPTGVQLGSFCVGQPTSSTDVALTSTGTATVQLAAPTLAGSASSPFELVADSPVSYPFALAASGTATVTVTPRREANAGPVTDVIVWASDAPSPQPTTMVAAAFINNGGAIAPASIDYGDAPIHVAVANDQLVTIQNCGTTPMTLDAPTITPTGTFHIDGAALPSSLAPSQSATLSVGFDPIEKGVFEAKLDIVSSSGSGLLEVALVGSGILTGGPGSGSGAMGGGGGGCGCHTSDPSAGLLVALGCLMAVTRRRAHVAGLLARRNGVLEAR